MINFIKHAEEEKEEDPFEVYYDKEISPKLEKQVKLRQKYHRQFWGLLWSAVFINSANVLFILYHVIMNKHSFSLTQVLIVLVISLLIVLYPIYRYKKRQDIDIFDTFIEYYGNWQHSSQQYQIEDNLPIVPPHKIANVKYELKGTYANSSFSVFHMEYLTQIKIGKYMFNINKGRGLHIRIEIPEKIPAMLIMFDAASSYKKKKIQGYSKIVNNRIPASNYFYTFSSEKDWASNFIRAALFERLLDFKMGVNAKHICAMFDDKYIDVYLEGFEYYICDKGFWKSSLGKDYFIKLNKNIQEMLLFIEVLQDLIEVMNRNE